MNYVLNEEKMFADVTDGIAIIINSETGIYYGLNGLGTAVYENLMNGSSVAEVLSALKSISGVPADIEAKLNEFISKLVNYELIMEGPSTSAEANFDSSVAAEENFEMLVNEYNDAQELLLADPIHEVKEETGWTPEKDSIGYSKEETREREKKMEEQVQLVSSLSGGEGQGWGCTKLPKVSVIIPVYNTEKYLKKCLDSVCNQTLQDIEIICINDCSQDNCLEILKAYALSDTRVRIIDFKENRGAGAARNAGIEAAQGEYIGFVDSDDFIDLDFYEKLYNSGTKTKANVVKGAVEHTFLGGQILKM